MIFFANLAQHIDTLAYFERQGVRFVDKPTHSREGLEAHGNCPACGGTDRFSVWPETGRWSCAIRSSGCGIHGSNAYWYARDILGLNHQQALEDLGIDPFVFEGDSYSQKSDIKLPLFLTRDEPPARKWQDAAGAFCRAAEKCLWTSKGETARKYLQSRGLSEQTIRSAHLGLCPDWYKAPLTDWGLSPEQLLKEDDPQIKVPRGVTIPWFVGNDVWKIQIRRPDKQYFQVLGSSDCLYNANRIQTGWPGCLFESEFDALSAEQEAGELAAMLATGSTTKAFHAASQLVQCSCVLQCFDDDEAGRNGAAVWLKKLQTKGMRWKPWAHDCNDMLKANPGEIRTWLEYGLLAAQVSNHSVVPSPEEQARLLLQQFEAEQGEIYIRADGQMVYRVPDHWSDERYQQWAEKLDPYYEQFAKIVGRAAS